MPEIDEEVLENGRVEIFVANESNIAVFFDNLAITHLPTLISQENHYYAFGMNAKEIEKDGKPDNLFQYNGKEKESFQGLEWNDYGAMNYDSEVGRWWGVDAKAEKYMSISPYNYCLNNPIKFIDPDGNFVLPAWSESMGITREAYDKFSQLLGNVHNLLVEGNKQVMKGLRNSTGLTDAQIKKIFTMGDGPKISFAKGLMTMAIDKDNIRFNAETINNLDNKKNNFSTQDMAIQVVGIAITVIHEVVHIGDMMTNNGKTTGQYNSGGGYWDDDGKQAWGRSIGVDGHRGTDIEMYGFGVRVDNYNGKYDIVDLKGTIVVPLNKTLPAGETIESIVGNLPVNFYPKPSDARLKHWKINKTIEQHQKDIIKRFIPHEKK
ncbi:MAG: RHS repeat-associated core domain-containing protein [Cytophagales bacterium]|nr:MAG: RHS repeat-associated core domain-containing protein [Cytophagales bacterium]